MSHTIVIYGYSDDLIEIDGDAPGCDEYNPGYPDDTSEFLITTVGDGGAEAKVRVRVTYNTDGVWEITTRQVEEDMPTPEVHLSSRGYSMQATIGGVTKVELVTSAPAGS